MESEKDVQDLKSQLEKAKKQRRPVAKRAQESEEQLRKLQLENETLQSTLRAFDARSKQDGENSSKGRFHRNEEGARIVVENEVHQASLAAGVTYKSLSKREVGKLHI